MGLTIRTAQDVLDMVGTAFEADGLLLTADDVDAGFFDLRIGLAGELLQKVTNYGLRLALVLPHPGVHGPRWTELANEHARHRMIRFLPDAAEAEAWLRG